jgi:hypothetical protein
MVVSVLHDANFLRQVPKLALDCKTQARVVDLCLIVDRRR